ncbi:MAG: hypothetical protein ABSA47_00055 [Verrucomicrobiota bacterium]|jgi:hypothetical protein
MRITQICGAACGAVLVFIAGCLFHSALKPEKPAASVTTRVEWVGRCLDDFAGVKVGMTRSEVEAVLAKDGGWQGVSTVRFVHPTCAYFKMDVEFDFKRNPADQNRAITGKEDKVIRVSKPYIEEPDFD